jgi:hypothetical protein
MLLLFLDLCSPIVVPTIFMMLATKLTRVNLQQELPNVVLQCHKLAVAMMATLVPPLMHAM